MQKINGETATGLALIILAILFIFAGMVNEVWAKLFLASVVILILGIAFTILGIVTIIRSNKNKPKSSHSTH